MSILNISSHICNKCRLNKFRVPTSLITDNGAYQQALSECCHPCSRIKVFEDIERMIHPECVIDRVVYDMDDIVTRAGSAYSSAKSHLTNRDQLRYYCLFD